MTFWELVDSNSIVVMFCVLIICETLVRIFSKRK
jgi:hypothetical protein